MMFLATFFPMPEMEEDESDKKFDLVNDLFRATVDIADLVGIYQVMQRVSDRQGQCKDPGGWPGVGHGGADPHQAGLPVGGSQGSRVRLEVHPEGP